MERARPCRPLDPTLRPRPRDLWTPPDAAWLPQGENRSTSAFSACPASQRVAVQWALYGKVNTYARCDAQPQRNVTADCRETAVTTQVSRDVITQVNRDDFTWVSRDVTTLICHLYHTYLSRDDTTQVTCDVTHNISTRVSLT